MLVLRKNLSVITIQKHATSLKYRLIGEVEEGSVFCTISQSQLVASSTMILKKDNIWQHPIILAKRSQSIYATSRKELGAPLICARWVKQCASMIVKKNLICITIIFIIYFYYHHYFANPFSDSCSSRISSKLEVVILNVFIT